MNQNNIKYTTYLNILHEELKPAMGCTEPIALAYAAAKARDILGAVPDRIILEVSGSIIKNVKSVIVPNTNHQKGIDTAVAAGIIAGKTEKELEVLADITPEQYDAISDYKARTPIEVIHVEHGHSFEISITVFKGNSNATVRILDYHTDIVFISKNSEVLLQKELQKTASDTVSDRSLLNIEDIWDFSQTVAIQDVKPVLDRQIQYNFAIAQEGLRGNYGANIGSVLLTNYGSDIRTKTKAYAAAGSDARMNGCDLPVVINSGSGNQGITCSVPLIIYAKELHCSDEQLYRALVLSNLVAIHEKTGIGTLSAFCGAVSAGAGAGAGIAYLCGGGYREVIHTIVNSLAVVSGIVCDGAKASCAAKIASSVDAGIMGYEMFKLGQEFKSGDGIVMKDIETTIKGIGRLGKDGMKQTNDEIISLMIQEDQIKLKRI